MENFVKDIQENRMKNLEKMKHQKEENIQANISRTEEESFSIDINLKYSKLLNF